MSKLYEELRDLAVNDATVYAHLKMQQKGGLDDFNIAIALIRSLVHEKKAYFDDAVKTRELSVVPLIVPKNAVFRYSIWQRISLWFRRLK